MVAHIFAGSVGMAAGFVALYSAKGAPLHRRAGMVFVYVMLAMTFTGTVLAAVRGAAPTINIPAAVLTAYLVVTGFTTVRPPASGGRALHVGGMLIALGVGIFALALGFVAVANGGTFQGMPAFPYFLFGFVGLLGGSSDVRMLRLGPPRGAVRITRHLWRMSFALWIAVMSFFFGQADELPKALRIPALLATPVLAVLVTMLYWLWRVRIRRSLRGLAGIAPPGVEGAR